MSDNEWFEQMKKSFTLNIGDDNQYLWEPLKDEKNYFVFYHHVCMGMDNMVTFCITLF